MIKIGKTIILNEDEEPIKKLTTLELDSSNFILRIHSETGKVTILKNKYVILHDKL